MTEAEFIEIDDAERWEQCLPASRNVFSSAGYARVFWRYRQWQPRIFAVSSREGAICYPLFLRPLDKLPWGGGMKERWDATTPEFTGPMACGDISGIAGIFGALRDASFADAGIVTEFAHLNPWSAAAAELPGFEAELNREIVWVDTTLPTEELWREHMVHACRKNIAIAESNTVEIREGRSDEEVAALADIYAMTMRRKDALATYRFPLEFFLAIRNELPANSRFVLAMYRGRAIAATLYLYDGENVYSFLGGADHEFQQLRPTNLLIWRTIEWAHATGRRRLVLGGGYKPDDGIFRFKAGFSRLRQPFSVYKRVHRRRDYEELEVQRRAAQPAHQPPPSYFPSYRHEA